MHIQQTKCHLSMWMAGVNRNRDPRTDSFRWANQVRSGIRARLWDQNKRALTANEAVGIKPKPQSQITTHSLARRLRMVDGRWSMFDGRWIMRDIILNRCSNVKAKHRSGQPKKPKQPKRRAYTKNKSVRIGGRTRHTDDPQPDPLSRTIVFG